MSDQHISTAYIAGLLDGKATFGIYTVRNGKGFESREARIIVTSTDPALPDWLHEQLGGIRSEQKPKAKISKKVIHRWQLAGGRALDLARRIQPYVIFRGSKVSGWPL
jgi:hypothetical protein